MYNRTRLDVLLGNLLVVPCLLLSLSLVGPISEPEYALVFLHLLVLTLGGISLIVGSRKFVMVMGILGTGSTLYIIIKTPDVSMAIALGATLYMLARSAKQFQE